MQVSNDPLRVAWHTHGAPVPPLAWRGPGVCDRCTASDPRTVRIIDVVSDKFTGWEQYGTASKHPLWCPSCAWGHSDPALRLVPWVVQGKTARKATSTDLAVALASPLPTDLAVIVPVSRKKHLFPQARWGVVTTDDIALPWGSAEVQRLDVLRTLRRYGFNEQALSEAAPRFDTLRTLGPAHKVEVLHLWPLLDPWRQMPLFMQVGIKASRLEKAA